MRKDLPKPSKPKPSTSNQASQWLKKSKTNPGLSYTSSGKAVFTPTPAKPKAQPKPSGTKTGSISSPATPYYPKPRGR